MFLLMLTLPFASFATIVVSGRHIGSQGSWAVSCVFMSLCTLLSSVLFYECHLCSSTVTLDLSPWFTYSRLVGDVRWGLDLDELSSVMCVTVSSVSTAVHVYSVGYMQTVPHAQRFQALISLFTGFMILLVTSNNYALLFVGWEGIGVCSYTLVSYWYTRTQAVQAAMQAMCMNRAGDAALTVALLGLILSSPDLSFDLTSYDSLTQSSHQLVGVCLTLAASAKSAQLGLHTWLPNAIEAPTPVSALIHAATLVTAGVYLLARSTPLLEDNVLLIIEIVGALTAVFGSYTALVQTDFKRVIAYSTCSQIGYLVTGVGISLELGSISHLVAHAHFKALLFLTAGALLHSISDVQDVGSLGPIHLFPLVGSCLVVGSLTIMALPGTDAGYTKDLIIECAEGAYAPISLSDNLALGASFTAGYSISSLLVLSEAKGSQSDLTSGHDTDQWTNLPLILLMFTSMMLSWLFQDSNGFLDNEIESQVWAGCDHWAEMVDSWTSVEFHLDSLAYDYGLLVCALGAFTAYLQSEDSPSQSRILSQWMVWSNFLSEKSFFDVTVNTLIRGVISVAYLLYKHLERGVIEALGPYGIGNQFILYAHDSLLRPSSRRIVLSSALTTGWSALAGFTLYYMGHLSSDTSLLLIALLLF